MAAFTNQTTLSYNGLTTTSNVVTGEITQVLILQINTTINTYKVNDTITYVISIQNSGSTDYTGLVLTDNLGSYSLGTQTFVPLTYTNDPILYYLNGYLQDIPYKKDTKNLVLNEISILAGTSSIIIYRVNINKYVPLLESSSISNTVTLSGGNLSKPITSCYTITVNPNPEPSIIKSITPKNVVENEELTYTFNIQNTGPTKASNTSNIINSSNMFFFL